MARYRSASQALTALRLTVSRQPRGLSECGLPLMGLCFSRGKRTFFGRGLQCTWWILIQFVGCRSTRHPFPRDRGCARHMHYESIPNKDDFVITWIDNHSVDQLSALRAHTVGLSLNSIPYPPDRVLRNDLSDAKHGREDGGGGEERRRTLPQGCGARQHRTTRGKRIGGRRA